MICPLPENLSLLDYISLILVNGKIIDRQAALA
jgi:hypothetical protein